MQEIVFANKRSEAIYHSEAYFWNESYIRVRAKRAKYVEEFEFDSKDKFYQVIRVSKGVRILIDKQKILAFLRSEIESCKIAENFSDKQIIWECKRIIRMINAGQFDKEHQAE